MKIDNNDYEIQLEDYKMRLDIALKTAHICVFEVDIVHQLYTSFENSEDIFGVSEEMILNDVQPYSQLTPQEYQEAVSLYFCHPDDYEIIDLAFQSIYQGKKTSYEARMKAGQSEFKWCKIDVTPIINQGIPTKMIGVITDIDQLKRRNLALQSAVMYDGFTGLFNKQTIMDSIFKTFKEYPNQHHAFFLLDIDDFKKINDTYGHLNGDQIILQLSQKLKITFQQNNIIGRFGGDEFIGFVQNMTNNEYFIHQIQNLITCQKDNLLCHSSIGIALYPQDGTTLEELINHADQALYHAKHTKQGYCFYIKKSMNEKILENISFSFFVL